MKTLLALLLSTLTALAADPLILTNVGFGGLRITGVSVVGGGAGIPLTTNLVAYWKLDEASGNRADSVGSSTMGDTYANVGNAAGKIGNAASFTENSELLSADSATLSMGTTQDYTISLWAYPTAHINPQAWLGKGAESAGSTEYVVESLANSSWYYLVSDGTNFRDLYGGPTTIDTNTWYHVVVTCDASEGDIVVRVNDTTSWTNTAATYSRDWDNALRLGAHAGGAFARGRLDEVGIWKRLLTPAEITELYNSGNGKTYPFTP